MVAGKQCSSMMGVMTEAMVCWVRSMARLMRRHSSSVKAPSSLPMEVIASTSSLATICPPPLPPRGLAIREVIQSRTMSTGFKIFLKKRSAGAALKEKEAGSLSPMALGTTSPKTSMAGVAISVVRSDVETLSGSFSAVRMLSIKGVKSAEVIVLNKFVPRRMQESVRLMVVMSL